mmetsp:Transcript_27788/g.65311  ORF Transcript_27788/g.65311 Transcript_27788/m.65311 type:complete len:400 (+) Transcript_27788:406-1605(+)
MSGSKKGCSICRMLSSGMSILLVAAGAYAAWFFLGQPSGDELIDIAKGIGDQIKDIDFGDLTGALENFTGFTPDLWNEDPFVGDNTTNRWQGYTKGEGGLYLELLNALNDTWSTEYSEAVSDWNNWCDTKVLVLTSRRVEVDNACSDVDGVMKVCNGNYGETGWLGINQILKSVPQGIIQSSVAKMNEHYLLNADYDERLYTMCHELGHGYGLPHTDENFNNKDQGNCLDYTNTPSNNLRPGVANCNRLLEVYGAVDVGGRRRISQKQAQRSLRYRSDAEAYEDFGDGDDGTGEESFVDDARYYYEYARSQYPNMTAEYEHAMHELYYDIAQGNVYAEEQEEEDASIDVDEQIERPKWRRLREHPRGGDFSRRLNEGFELEVHVLYPNNKNNKNEKNHE